MGDIRGEANPESAPTMRGDTLQWQLGHCQGNSHLANARPQRHSLAQNPNTRACSPAEKQGKRKTLTSNRSSALSFSFSAETVKLKLVCGVGVETIQPSPVVLPRRAHVDEPHVLAVSRGALAERLRQLLQLHALLIRVLEIASAMA